MMGESSSVWNAFPDVRTILELGSLEGVILSHSPGVPASSTLGIEARAANIEKAKVGAFLWRGARDVRARAVGNSSIVGKLPQLGTDSNQICGVIRSIFYDAKPFNVGFRPERTGCY
jgi:hypothetical protein